MNKEFVKIVFGRDIFPQKKKLASVPRQDRTGCEYCPRDGVPGINKVMGTVDSSKEIMVWAQSPGPDENNERRELCGRSGQWWWKEMSRVGLKRADCTIQNVMRCLAADYEDGRWAMRDPSNEELQCCSVYTRRAIEKQNARIWIVLGKIAEERLFGKRGKNPEKVFWRGDTRVFILDHPAYFLRGAPREKLEKFRLMLRIIAREFRKPSDGRFGILKRQDYRAIVTKEQAIGAGKEILNYAKDGNRISWDVEDDVIDGRRLMLCAGACPKPGLSYVFLMDHPQNTAPDVDRQAVKAVVKKLLCHPHLKVMMHGNHDVDAALELLGVAVQGYDYDVQYADYFCDSVYHTYSLSSIVSRRLPEFAGYKGIAQTAVPSGLTVEEGREIGEFHVSRMPISDMVLYNGGDCDVTKRIELCIGDTVPLQLLRVYKDAAFILAEMENNPPLVDREQINRVKPIWSGYKQSQVEELRVISGDPCFNPNTPKDVAALLFDKLRLEQINGRSTEKECLQLLSKNNVPAVNAMLEYRRLKSELERIDAMERSADAHGDCAKTIWWLTGTRTGRLSSGGGKRKDARKLVNLQNMAHNDHIRNIIISDKNWREFDRDARHSVDNAIRKWWNKVEWIVSVDFSQQELRVLAQVSGDENMIKAFQSGKDIHAEQGRQWSGWDYQMLVDDDKKRKIIKGFHFGIVYGLTPDGLVQDLLANGVNPEEMVDQAKLKGTSDPERRYFVALELFREFIHKCYREYFKRFPRVRAYMDSQPTFAEEHGYVENLFKFRTPISTEGRSDRNVSWRNQSMNSGIQGGAHQILLCVMAIMKRERKKYDILRPRMEIHDALDMWGCMAEVDCVVRLSKDLMEKRVLEMTTKEFGIKWRVPLQADAKIGLRFGAMVKYTGDWPGMVSSVVKKHEKQEDEMRGMELGEIPVKV